MWDMVWFCNKVGYIASIFSANSNIFWELSYQDTPLFPHLYCGPKSARVLSRGWEDPCPWGEPVVYNNATLETETSLLAGNQGKICSTANKNILFTASWLSMTQTILSLLKDLACLLQTSYFPEGVLDNKKLFSGTLPDNNLFLILSALFNFWPFWAVRSTSPNM